MNKFLSYIVTVVSGEIGFAYEESDIIPISVEWVEDINSFASEEEIPTPDEVTPYYVRLSEGGGYSYFRKALTVGKDGGTVSVAVSMGGIPDSPMFSAYNMPCEWVSVSKSYGVLNISISPNGTESDRSVDMVIENEFDRNDAIHLYILQEHEDYAVIPLEAVISDCRGDHAVDIDQYKVSCTFDSLVEQTDCPSQTLHVSVSVKGGLGMFSVKRTEEYECVGILAESPDIYGNNGKWYQKVTGYRGGYPYDSFVEVVVHDGKAYRRCPYDNALSVSSDRKTFIEITSYGQAYTGKDHFYVITLAHRDDFSKKCIVEAFFADTD